VLKETTQNNDLQQEVDRLLLASYVPAGVVVDAEMNILQVRGHTGPYLELAPGKTSLNLLNMAREGLRRCLRSAISAARKSHSPVTREHVRVTAFDSTQELRITVLPLKGPPAERYFLVLFEEEIAPASLPALSEEQPGRTSMRGSSARRIAALELELATTRVEMRAMLEERDAANEELQAANEEIRSSNEELQSINEELETYQKELQATNQELATANQAFVKRSEQVQIAQERTNAIVETVREPLVVLTQDGHIERANTAFYQFFQVLPQETVGSLLSDLGNGQWNIPRLRFLLEQVSTTNEPFHDFEVEHIFPLIGHKILLLNARRIVDEPAGARDHLLLLAIEDITARKELERQKDLMLGMTSHELKTPLAALRGMLQLVQRRLKRAVMTRHMPPEWGNFVKDLTKSLEDSIRQIDVQTRLINDLLDASRITTKTLKLSPERCDLISIVRQTVEDLQAIAPERSLVLALPEPAVVPVLADGARISQVVTNYVTNALRYSSSDQPVYIGLTIQEDVARVWVRDQGPGISEEAQKQLWQRFHQVEEVPVLSGSGKGLGLGLYICQTLIEQHQGAVGVESTPGEGSTFWFTLPMIT
jgi:two-component system, chemotaxis family, CheB/CheR fusion protein